MKRNWTRDLLVAIVISIIVITGLIIAGWQGALYSMPLVGVVLLANAAVRICSKCFSINSNRMRGIPSAVWCRRCGAVLQEPPR
jgi:hypothetical protein